VLEALFSLQPGNNPNMQLMVNPENLVQTLKIGEVLKRYIVDAVKKEFAVDITTDVAAIKRIEAEVDQAKEQLESRLQAVIQLPRLVEKPDGFQDLQLTLTHVKFRRLCVQRLLEIKQEKNMAELGPRNFSNRVVIKSDSADHMVCAKFQLSGDDNIKEIVTSNLQVIPSVNYSGLCY
jgi:molecular chaperone DnaK (HSP70)